MPTTPLLEAITVAADGAAFGVAQAGGAVRQSEPAPTDAGDWQALPAGPSLTQLSAAHGGDVWAVTAQSAVYRSQGAAWNPQPLSFVLDQVSAASDGAVWGVHDGGPLRYTGTAFEPVACQVQLTLVDVAAGGSVFGLDAQGVVYAYTGDALWPAVLPAPPAPAVDVSMSDDRLLWIVGKDGNLYLYLDEEDGWYQAGSGFRRVCAATDAAMWAIDAQGYPRVLAAGEPLASEGTLGPGEGNRKRWDTESVYDQARSTHLWIVNQAATLAGGAVAALVQPQPMLVKHAIGDAFHDQLCHGLRDADFKAPWNDPWGPFGYQPISKLEQAAALYKSHFYDPDSGRNWKGNTSPTALTRVRSLATFATERWLFGDAAGAGYHLGLALHYLTDVTQPMHAGNFTYLSSDPYGWHTAFEQKVMELTGTAGAVAVPSAYTPSTITDPDAFVVAAARNAKSNYLTTVCPPLVTEPVRQVVFNALVTTESWRTDLERLWQDMLPTVKSMLQDAVTVTAQFLVAWQAATQSGIPSSLLVCADSGQVLDAPPEWTILPQVQPNRFNGGMSQRWRPVALTGADAGYYQLVSGAIVGPPGSSLVLDVQGSAKNAGAQVIVHPFKNGDNQKWKPVPGNSGTERWQNKNSGLFLTVSAPGTSNASVVQQAAGTGAQDWLRAPVEIDTLTWAGTSLVADVPHGSTKPAVQLQLYGRKNGNTNQEFAFLPVPGPAGADDSVFVILSRSSGLPIGVDDSGRVVQTPWVFRARDQQWRRTPVEIAFTATDYLESVSQPKSFMRPATKGLAGDLLQLSADPFPATPQWFVVAVPS